QVPRRRAGRRVRDPQVGLAVRPDRIAVQGADERDPPAVAREAELVDRALDADDFGDLSAGCRNAVQLGMLRLIVRLRDAIRREVDRRSIWRPFGASLVEVAGGELPRFGQLPGRI